MSVSKRAAAVVISLAIAIVMAGCSQTSAADVDLLRLRDSMLAADSSLPDMSVASSQDENAEELFAYLSDIPYEIVEEYFFAYASLGTPEEIAVIELKDEADTAEAVKSLEEHVDNRISLFEFYAPDYVTMDENALIFASGRCAVMIISGGQDQIKKAFESFLG